MDLEALMIQMQYNGYVLEVNSGGLTTEDSVVRLEPGGNSYNWILGHILSSRNKLLRMLSREPVWDADLEKQYDRGTVSIKAPADAYSLPDMLRDLKISQDSILQGMQNMKPEALAAKAPFSPGGNPMETIGSLLATLVFHESYHAGQTGIIRRLLGKEGAIR